MKRVLAVATLVLVFPASTGAGGRITVFAAASLAQAFPRIDRSPRYSFAGSDQLALELQQGAPADVYAAASPKFPELLYRSGLLHKPVVFATNKLVVIVPRGNPAHIVSVYDLRRLGTRVVIGDKSVPIGAPGASVAMSPRDSNRRRAVARLPEGNRQHDQQPGRF